MIFWLKERKRNETEVNDAWTWRKDRGDGATLVKSICLFVVGSDGEHLHRVVQSKGIEEGVETIQGGSVSNGAESSVFAYVAQRLMF